MKRILFLVLAILLLSSLAYFIFLKTWGENDVDIPQEIDSSDNEIENPDNLHFYYDLDKIPSTVAGTVIFYPFFALSYVEEMEIAEWTAYENTRERLKGKVDRRYYFKTDTSLPENSASDFDYRGSGLDRGHLVPAADMAFDSTGVELSFLMSNISPQERAFNRGIWRELEEQVRDWTRKNKHLYIVTGPVLSETPKRKIGKEKKIPVPLHYYKVLLDYTNPGVNAIGFLIPNEKSEKSISEYAVPVDKIESLTGIDFFSFLPDSVEDRLESEVDAAAWEINNFWFDLRIRVWNR